MDKLSLIQLGLKHSPDELLEFLEDLKKIVIAYKNGDITEPTEPTEPVDPIEPEEPEEPVYKTFDGWIADVSDYGNLSGQLYIKPASIYDNKIKSMRVGSETFTQKNSKYPNLWYGKNIPGYITVELNDGTHLRSSSKVEKANDVPSSGGVKLSLRYNGRSNNERPTYYTFTNKHLKVGDRVTFKVGNIMKTVTAIRRDNGSIGYPKSSGGGSQLLIKNSEVAGRGISVLTPSNSPTGQSGYVEFL